MYTKSIDGIERDTIHVKFRVTKEQKRIYKKLAEEYGCNDIKEWIVSRVENDMGILVDAYLNEREWNE